MTFIVMAVVMFIVVVMVMGNGGGGVIILSLYQLSVKIANILLSEWVIVLYHWMLISAGKRIYTASCMHAWQCIPRG